MKFTPDRSRLTTFFVLTICLFSAVAATATLLQNGVALPNRSDLIGGQAFYQMMVPSNATSLTVTLKGGKGNADLYAKFGSEPSTTDFDQASTNPGNKEKITVKNPQPGKWIILVNASSSYLGATLLAQFVMSPGNVAPPVIQPPEGTFPGKAVVQIKSPTPNATIRYTTDGSDPGILSLLYRSPITSTQTIILNTRGFKNGATPSAAASATLAVLTNGTVTDLQSGVAETGLAGSGSSSAFFHINVPTNQNRLVIRDQSASSPTEIFVKFGSLPTGTNFDGNLNVIPGHETLTITNPAAGDWFILLAGKRDFSGAALTARYYVSGADLIPWQPSAMPAISTESFSTNDCVVQEGEIPAGTRRLLRFTTEVRNIGDQDVVIGNPVNNPLFELDVCESEWEFKGYADYRLLDLNTNEVATGEKVGFCLEDVNQWDPGANPASKYDCSFQGIQAGWGDVYDSSLAQQWIDITDVPAGDYLLEISVNPDRKIAETDYSNNSVTIPFHIPPAN